MWSYSYFIRIGIVTNLKRKRWWKNWAGSNRFSGLDTQPKYFWLAQLLLSTQWILTRIWLAWLVLISNIGHHSFEAESYFFGIDMNVKVYQFYTHWNNTFAQMTLNNFIIKEINVVDMRCISSHNGAHAFVHLCQSKEIPEERKFHICAQLQRALNDTCAGHENTAPGANIRATLNAFWLKQTTRVVLQHQSFCHWWENAFCLESLFFSSNINIWEGGKKLINSHQKRWPFISVLVRFVPLSLQCSQSFAI